jgi:hypothetical protein
VYASRHKNSRTDLTGGGPQPLKPPPRTERDRERERLEKIEREERERQERLANARYDRVGAAKDRSRLPPPSYTTVTGRPSESSIRAGDIHAGVGIPLSNNFDRDLEVARAGSPSASAYSNSARGTGTTGSVREHTSTSDLSAPQPGNRSYTPDDRMVGAGGRFTPERYNSPWRQQQE